MLHRGVKGTREEIICGSTVVMVRKSCFPFLHTDHLWEGRGGNETQQFTSPCHEKKPGLFNPRIMFFLDLIGGIITSYIESSRLVSLNLIQGRVGVQLPPGYYRGVSQGFIHAPLSVFFFCKFLTPCILL